MPNQNENKISFAATRDEGATHPEINLRIIDRSAFDKTKRILDQTSPETQRPPRGTPPRSETRQRYEPPSRKVPAKKPSEPGTPNPTSGHLRRGRRSPDVQRSLQEKQRCPGRGEITRRPLGHNRRCIDRDGPPRTEVATTRQDIHALRSCKHDHSHADPKVHQSLPVTHADLWTPQGRRTRRPGLQASPPRQEHELRRPFPPRGANPRPTKTGGNQQQYCHKRTESSRHKAFTNSTGTKQAHEAPKRARSDHSQTATKLRRCTAEPSASITPTHRHKNSASPGCEQNPDQHTGEPRIRMHPRRGRPPHKQPARHHRQSRIRQQ